ncbi:MAG: efflux RND transporter permease subunit [Pseudomonadota bacterium]
MHGIIKWMTHHPVAANLTMIFVTLVGIASATQLSQKTFPEFALDTVSISIGYQGASPSEVTQSIIRPIEDQLASVPGIDDIDAIASEGRASVSVSFLRGENVPEKLQDIKTEIDRITVFPEDADEPVVVQSDNNTRALEITVHGNVSEQTLTRTAERLKDELTALPAVSFVETSNIRDFEVAIEVDRDTLTAYGLTMADIAQIVRANSLELPGGAIDTETVSIPLRTIGRNFERDDFENIVVRTGDNGAKVLLGDIATVNDGFEDTDLRGRFAGQPSVTVNVFRVGEEQVLEVVAASETYIDDVFRATLPEGVSVTIWQNEATVLQSRIDLLAKNAFTGFILVIVCLALFLDIRLAFWSTMGIGIAFVASFAVMPFLGLSINMISLFGFILAIGIVVDNAIVVSENIFKNGENGKPPIEAAVFGAQRVAIPVVFSALTTIVAFVPLTQLPAPLGSFLIDIPLIVIVVLSLSLLQSLLILPRNLASMRVGPDYRPPIAFWPLTMVRKGVDAAVKWFIRGPLDAVLHFATKRFLVPIAGVIAAMMMVIGLLAHGFVKFEFFPSIDGEFVIASIEMQDGTSLQRTEAVAERIRLAALRAGETLEERTNHSGSKPIVENINMTIGALPAGGPFGGAPTQAASVGNVTVRVTDPEFREWPTSDFETLFVEEIGEIAGVKQLNVTASVVDAGDPIALEASMPDGQDIGPVVADMRAYLTAVPGVFGIQDNNSSGRPEYKLALKDDARVYGLTLNDLATQMRNNFFGVEATRVQRGSDDVQVFVRLPEEQRDSLFDLLETQIRTPAGALIPLSTVATVTEGVAPAEIIRRNGRTITTVIADVDTSVITGQEANTLIAEELIPDLRERYEGLVVDFGGEQRTQGDAQAALGNATMVALFVIFALLALIFRSYVQPIIVMIAIPLGLIGAVTGHFIMGVSIGLLSIFGIIGLAGVVINNSLVMIDLYNEYLEKGADTRTAVIEGTKDRFRPILLTSLTTFLGIFPLLQETSVQAQFLIPLAVSIGYGVLLGTVVIVLAVPSFFILQAHIFRTFISPEKAEALRAEREADALNASKEMQHVEQTKPRKRKKKASNDDQGPETAEEGFLTAAE